MQKQSWSTKHLWMGAVGICLAWAAWVSAASAFTVNEVVYDPAGADTGKEWIELYNRSESAIDLTGWQLNAVSGDYYTFPAFFFPPRSFVVIRWGAAGADSQTELFTGSFGFGNMGNTSGFVALFNSSLHTKDTIVDYIEYGAGDKTWESTASGAGIWVRGTFIADAEEGYAIGLAKDGEDANTPSDWTAFAAASPGTANAPLSPTPSPAPEQTPTPTPSPASTPAPTTTPTPAFSPLPSQTPSPTLQSTVSPTQIPALTPPALPRVRINEFYPNTTGSDADGEWIELWNEESLAADISNWKLDDTDGGSPPYAIPQGATIASWGYIVFSRPITGIALNNDVDIVRLIAPDGHVVESVSYEKPPQGASSNRTAQGAFVWSFTPTPGGKNTFATVKPSESVWPSPVPSETGRPEASVNAKGVESLTGQPYAGTIITKTMYATTLWPSAMPHVTSPDGLYRENASSVPAVFESGKLAADIGRAAPPPYKSFFSRYALALMVIAACIGAAALIRWRRKNFS